MPIFSRGECSILFIHIPKCGGSSVETIAARQGWAESFSIRGKPLSRIAYCKASFQHVHAPVLNELFDFERFDAVFTLVRHPFERFKSEYYWQRFQSITTLGVDEWVEDTLSRYRDNPFLYDNHIRPQIEFLPDFPAVRCFRLEDRGVEQAARLLAQHAPSEEGGASVSTAPVEEKKSPRDPAIEAAFERHRPRVQRFYQGDVEAFYPGSVSDG